MVKAIKGNDIKPNKVEYVSHAINFSAVGSKLLNVKSFGYSYSSDINILFNYSYSYIFLYIYHYY